MAGVRQTVSMVTFRRPFLLASIGIPLPAGTYRLIVDEAYRSTELSRRTTTMTLYLPAIKHSAMPLHAHGIDPTELENALVADLSQKSSTEKNERNE